MFSVFSHLQALFKAEDEQDACAATRAKAEQAAELAEFDEGIPLSEDGSGKVSMNNRNKDKLTLDNYSQTFSNDHLCITAI